MTKLGVLVQQLGPNKWLITSGEQVPAFIFANGPAFVTHYNFNQARGRKVDLKYLAINSHLPSRKPDMQDILTLTPAGVELSKRDPHAVVYEWEFACTGKSLYTTTAPNCHRTCCGGYGTCLEACGGRAHGFSSCSILIIVLLCLHLLFTRDPCQGRKVDDSWSRRRRLCDMKTLIDDGLRRKFLSYPGLLNETVIDETRR